MDLEESPVFTADLQCQKLLIEAMKYHLLPERKHMLQSPRTKPRISTLGALYAVGCKDTIRGSRNKLIESIILKRGYILNTLRIMRVVLKPYLNIGI